MKREVHLLLKAFGATLVTVALEVGNISRVWWALMILLAVAGFVVTVLA